jgi:hypothetical protein
MNLSLSLSLSLSPVWELRGWRGPGRSQGAGLVEALSADLRFRTHATVWRQPGLNADPLTLESRPMTIASWRRRERERTEAALPSTASSSIRCCA